MNKKVLLILGVVLLGAGSGGAYYSSQKKEDSKPSTASSSVPETNASPESTADKAPEVATADKACDILTQDVASKLLDGSAKPDPANSEAPKDEDHVIISNCSYSSADGAKIATLLKRAAKDAEGSAHDKEQFGPNKPVGAQDVSGYGDMAYWDVNFKQLNILKGSNWYIITRGSKQPDARTLDQAKQLADQVLAKL